MKVSLLSLWLAVALWSAVIVSDPSCAIPDEYWNLYDVTATDFNATSGSYKFQANVCKDIEKECARTQGQPCIVCQWIGEGTDGAHSYCVAFSTGEVYSTLPDGSDKGTRIILNGDVCGDSPRKTIIDILCNKETNFLEFVNESPTCTYNFRLHQMGACTVSESSFTPTFTLLSVTSNSVAVAIDIGDPWQFWVYHVELNGVVAYRGTNRDVFIDGLDADTTYTVVVRAHSGDGAALNIVAPSVTKQFKTHTLSGPVHYLSQTGPSVAVGMVIALAIVAALVGIFKFVLPMVRGEGKKGFSLRDAERSNAFE